MESGNISDAPEFRIVMRDKASIYGLDFIGK